MTLLFVALIALVFLLILAVYLLAREYEAHAEVLRLHREWHYDHDGETGGIPEG